MEQALPDVPQTQTENTIVINEASESLDLISDPASPWHSASEQVKLFFSQIKEKHILIKEVTHSFEKKYGKSNICTKFFTAGQIYYTCQDCCKNGGGYIMCFCERCWEPSKHQGHNFGQRTSYGNSAYCDCGWEDRIKSESFCANHGSQNILQIEIPNEEREKFLKFFEPLIYIGLYLVVNTPNDNLEQSYWNQLSKILTQLCVSSLYYIRLFCEILEKKIIYQTKKISVLQAILTSRIDNQLMLFQVAGDKLGKVILAKVFSKLINSENWDQQSSYSTLIRDCYTEKGILIQLSYNGIFMNKYKDKYFDIAETEGKEGLIILINYLTYRKSIQTNERFMDFIASQFSKGTKENLVVKNVEIRKFLTEYLFRQLYKPETNVKVQQNDALANLNALASQIISIMCDYNTKNILDFSQKLKEHNIQQEQFSRFLELSMKTAKKIIYKIHNTSKEYQIVPILMMATSSQSSQQLIHTFWDSITAQNGGLRQDYIETIDVIYHLISIINNYQTHLLDLKDIKKQSNDEEKQNWFRSFLYENKSIDRDQIHRLRKSGEKLKFKNAGNIIKSLCSYREESNTFQYISEQKYPYVKLKFKMRNSDRRGNFRHIPTKNITLEDKFDIPESEEIKMFVKIFSHPNFLKNFKKKWQDKVKVNENNSDRVNFWKNFDLGFYYVFILVCANQFLRNHQNKELQEQINRIRTDKKWFKQLSSYCSTEEKLKVLLSIKQQIVTEEKKQQKTEQKQQKVQKCEKQKKEASDDKQEKQQKEETQQSPIKSSDHQEGEQQNPTLTKINSIQAKRQKFQKKRDQKYAKLNEKRNLALTKNYSTISNDNEDQGEQQVQQCLLCHQKAKKDKSLVYLGNLEKDSTLSSSFHGKQNKSSILLSSCFHAVHIKCYLQINKRDLEFSCPLCSKICNIIFPYKNQEKQLRQCQNVINAVFLVKFKSLNFKSLLSLLFMHLIESYGLNSLIYLPRYHLEKKSRRKMDEYVLSMLSYIYKEFIPNKKQQFNYTHQQFNESLQSCEKQLVKDIQLLLSNIIYSKISGKQVLYQQKLLEDIQNKMHPDELKVLTEGLEHLIGKQIIVTQKQNEKEGDLKQQPKIYQKLAFQVIDLPDNIQNFKELQCQKKCECNKQIEIMCLISGKGFCNSNPCNSLNKHLEQYKGNLLLIKFSNGKIIHLKNRSKKRSDDIYFDAFMLAYEDRPQDSIGETYELNKYKFSKIIQSFFETL